jgi:hypothetical protein
MSKHANPRSHKVDYRDIMEQRSPEQQEAINKMILFFVVLTLTIVFLFGKL